MQDLTEDNWWLTAEIKANTLDISIDSADSILSGKLVKHIFCSLDTETDVCQSATDKSRAFNRNFK